MDFREWEKVKILHCVVDPQLPGRPPKQSIFVPDIPDCEAYLYTKTGSVYFYFTKFNRKIIVPMGNIRGVEVEPHGEIQVKGRKPKQAEQGKGERSSREDDQTYEGIQA